MNQPVTAIIRPETSQKTSSNREPILVVEANADLGHQLVEQLAADGHPAVLARTAGQARSLAAGCPPRLLVLGDLDSPRGTLDLLEGIREPHGGHGRTASTWPQSLPVIVLSARTTQLDLLRAFEAGADDFLPRPARYLELRARMRALLRRSETRQEEVTLSIGPLTIDPAAHVASLHGKRLELRPLEFELLVHLARPTKGIQKARATKGGVGIPLRGHHTNGRQPRKSPTTQAERRWRTLGHQRVGSRLPPDVRQPRCHRTSGRRIARLATARKVI